MESLKHSGLHKVYFDYEYSSFEINNISNNLHIFKSQIIKYDKDYNYGEQYHKPTYYRNYVGFFIDGREYVLKVSHDRYIIQSIQGFQIFQDKLYGGKDIDELIFHQQFIRIIKDFRRCLQYIKTYNGEDIEVPFISG